MNHHAQRRAGLFTPELWAKVFKLVVIPPDIRLNWMQQKENQKAVHRVKLVCKQFRDVHSSYSGLETDFPLVFPLLATQLASLAPTEQEHIPAVPDCVWEPAG